MLVKEKHTTSFAIIGSKRQLQQLQSSNRKINKNKLLLREQVCAFVSSSYKSYFEKFFYYSCWILTHLSSTLSQGKLF